MIRKALNPGYYDGTYNLTTMDGHSVNSHHLDHCVDSIRQSLTCMPDVSPIVWQWVEKDKTVELVSSDIVHTCRNFDKIRDWAMEHRMVTTSLDFNDMHDMR